MPTFAPFVGERDREIDRDGRFADAAFAGRDGDDVFNAGNRDVVFDASALRNLGVHRDLDDRDAWQPADDLGRLRFHLLLYRDTPAWSARCGTTRRTAFDRKIADKSERDDVFSEIGVDDLFQGI